MPPTLLSGSVPHTLFHPGSTTLIMTSSGPSRPEVGDIPKALSSALPARLSSYRGSIPACHHGPRNVTLLCHDIQTVVTFTGKEDEPFNELKSLYFHAFQELEKQLDLEPTLPEYAEEEMPAFELLDTEYSIFYEGFSSKEIPDGGFIRIHSSLIKTVEEIRNLRLPKHSESVQRAGAAHGGKSSAAPALRPSLVSPDSDDAASTPDRDHSTIPASLPGAVTVSHDPALADPTSQSAVGLSHDDVKQELKNANILSESTNGPGDVDSPSKSAATDTTCAIPCDLKEIDTSDRKGRVMKFKRALWKILDKPLSSNFAAAVTLCICFTIAFSACALLAATHPMFWSGNDRFGSWFIAESVICGIFTIELGARAWSCPELRLFWRDAFNLIDLVAILPFYVELIFLVVNYPVPAVLRMLRMVRIFRLVKVSKGSVNVFSKTMLASMKLLYMLMFMMFLVTLVAGALLYYLERGRWNPILGIYERHGYYLCPVDDPADAGEDVRRSLLSDSLICERSESGYMCQYSWLRDPSCKPVYQPGPFISIWHATWFVMQTITTVGFGNDNPTSALGLTLSAGIIMFGMLVVSLPITVIGSNFSSTYKNHQRMLVQLKDEVHYQDMSLLKKFTYKLMYS